MLFNSFEFLIFFPIVSILFFVIPNRYRYIWLLICSYYFYMSWNPKYAVLIIFSTIITYSSGLLMGYYNESDSISTNKINRYKKRIVTVSIALNIGILFLFKYLNFLIQNINSLFSLVNSSYRVNHFDILLPVGISFYTFQALGYTIDVYRGDVKPERNFLKYALFVSFFPQLVAGPIERTTNLLSQINDEHRLKLRNLQIGCIWVLWGYFLKLVIADRVAVIVDKVYESPDVYRGLYIVYATVLFAIQIYCDFNGYTMIARGCAKIMDFDLMQNFCSPYLAMSISEFWRRWHISLSSWFRDYLYIPLGGNRRGNIRKYINLLIVFLISGLWHGAAWGYVIWGGLNGIYQVMAELLLPIRKKCLDTFRINVTSILYRSFRIIGTFVLVDISWIFFRARGIRESINVIGNMLSAKAGEYSLSELEFDERELKCLIIALVLLFVVDLLCYIKKDIVGFIINKGFWFRCIVYVLLFWAVVLTGVYGVDYDASSFIYFQF